MFSRFLSYKEVLMVVPPDSVRAENKMVSIGMSYGSITMWYAFNLVVGTPTALLRLEYCGNMLVSFLIMESYQMYAGSIDIWGTLIFAPLVSLTKSTACIYLHLFRDCSMVSHFWRIVLQIKGMLGSLWHILRSRLRETSKEGSAQKAELICQGSLSPHYGLFGELGMIECFIYISATLKSRLWEQVSMKKRI